MEQILVVDDEAAIGELIGVYLQNEGYRVFVCENAREALECIDKEKIDLVLLDVMLPDQSGFDVCRKIRENHNYPVIMLTARDQEIDKITGLTLGADDYITKPFRPLELIARVKAQLRRFIHYNPGQEDRDVAEVSGLRIDCRDHTCTLHGKKLSLTPTEFSILWVLCSNKGEVVESDRLFHEVWGDKYYSSNNNTSMVHIRHLREKMKDSAEHPKYIRTVWGVGYKIEG